MVDLAPTQVGEYPIACPKCGEPIACPVFVEPAEPRPREIVLRATVDIDPARDHLAEVHGVRLSRPVRPSGETDTSRTPKGQR